MILGRVLFSDVEDRKLKERNRKTGRRRGRGTPPFPYTKTGKVGPPAGRGANTPYISQAPSYRSRLTEPAASPAPGIDDVWRVSIGAGVAAWLMTVIADDAHLSRPLLPSTSSAIFVYN
jgi:hypothetical protein